MLLELVQLHHPHSLMEVRGDFDVLLLLLLLFETSKMNKLACPISVSYIPWCTYMHCEHRSIHSAGPGAQ